MFFCRARHYDTRTGRFISEDPIGFDGEDANLYRYVENSPVNSFDPLGLKKTFIYHKGILYLYGDNGRLMYKGRAISGPYKKGKLPSGLYSIGKMRNKRSGSYSCSNDTGYSLDLISMFSTDREDLRIHPDGGVPGTLGCIGVSCNEGQANELGDILRNIYNQPMSPWIDLEVK